MKIRQILSIGCFLWILASLRLAAQQPEIQPLPIDPKIRYGQLNNGLTYYIRHNAQPKDRADFFIAQNVGSILEDENQRGLAHFLEHMAFDGTKNFPGHGMDEFTESIGRNGARDRMPRRVSGNSNCRKCFRTTNMHTGCRSARST